MTPTGAPTAPQTRPSPDPAVDRDSLIALAAGRAWAFLGPASGHLSREPGDDEVRLLAAMHFMELRLRTAALEHLEALSADFRATEEAKLIRDAARRLPSDEIAPESRIATCARNLDALGDRAVSLRERFDAWASIRARTHRWFRAKDANAVLRRPTGGGDGEGEFHEWTLLDDLRSVASRVRLPEPSPDSVHLPPLYLDGAPPPWLLERALRAPLPDAGGYTPALTLIEPDTDSLLDALSLLDLSALLRDSRLRIIHGPDAIAALSRDLRERAGVTIDGPVLATRAEPTRATLQTIASAVESQGDEHERLTAKVRSVYTPRDDSWWAKRYASFDGASDERPRVCLFSCRYTTFVRHSMEDLAQALTDAGCSVRLLVEPDAHSRLTTIAYLREIATHEPDLIVVANYRKSDLKIPGTESIPWVCWVQDAMPHLVGPEDPGWRTRGFLAGHGAGWISASATHREDRIAFPIPVNTRKFNDRIAHGANPKARECDVAYVGNQSEPAEAIRDRYLSSAKSEQESRLLNAIYCDIAALSKQASTHWGTDLRDTIARRFREFGLRSQRKNELRTLASFAQPIADRMLRHETLQWAATICERRGWSFRVYGRGWENHPTLARHAHPAVDHDERLCAVYRDAGVHLHASVTTALHQRVFECACSGGLPLVRLTVDTLRHAESGAIADAARAAWPDGFPSHGFSSLPIADAPSLMAYTAQRARLGLRTELETASISPELERQIRDGAAPGSAATFWGLCAELEAYCFHSPQTLERLLERYLNSSRERQARIGLLSARTRERFSYGAFVETLLARVAARLIR